MSEGKENGQDHKVIPSYEEKGLQPIKPILQDDPLTVTTGLQPIKPAPKNDGGDVGDGKGSE